MPRFPHAAGPRRRVLPTFSFLLTLTAGGVLWRLQKEPAGSTAEGSSAQITAPEVTTPVVATRPDKPAKQRGAHQSAPATIASTRSTPGPAKPGPAGRIDSEETWDFNLSGQPLSIALALDEVLLRDADGKEAILPLTPPATEATLPVRLAALTSPGGVFPVAYLTGQPRSSATRRIITPDLRVQLDSAAAEKTAAENGLVIKDRPAYAPGWVVMTAPDPFAALDAMVNLRTVREVASADVLLAKQQSRRALPNDPLAANQWHLKRSGTAVAGSDLNIDSTWNYPAGPGTRGTGIRIGVVDDGLQTAHPDLSPNVDTVNDKDWNGGDADPNPGTGDDHGTACAGNAAARGDNGIGVTGTAPEATLVGMRLIAATVTDAQEAEAMAYLPDLIQIKSNSWGPDDTGMVLEGPGPLTLAAFQSTTTTGRNNKGNIILWAGGNGGEATDNSNYDGYANSIYTIAIGATDSAGRRASYSEPGANLVACAPSSGDTGTLGITTVDRTGTAGYNTASSASGGDYTNDFGGTSSATPTAAGIVALMLQKNPSLGWRDVQEILIRTAVKPPASTGWVDNAAGFHFNHNFGAGLIDATAAVNLAGSWTNLAAANSATSTQSGLSAAIPNNNTTGVTRTFDLSSSNLRVEQITLTLSATHSARGNLDITLTSPGGMTSKLAEVHGDTGANYSNWTFSSVRHWGETSTGTWTLKVADLSSTSNSTGGTLTAAELKLYGAPSTPVNPAPVARITQPVDGTVISPGTVVTANITATDLTLSNAAGAVTQVQLFDNNVSIGTDTTAPYTFSFSPGLGSHSLTAKATDSEGAIGTSVSVSFTVANQAPVITAATLSASGQSFSDTPLTVSSVTAADPEGTALSYAYQWETSVNQAVFTAEPGATTATAPALPGKLVRCVVTASDGLASSPPFTTNSVNLLTRPLTTAQTGAAYSYSSGLVLRGSDSALTRRAIIHEFSQGPGSSSSEWIEFLTLQTGSLAFWDLSDAAGNLLVFLDAPVWDNIPAGTLILVYNGASKDPILPADDLDPTDGRMLVSSTNAAYFDNTYDPWLPLGNSGDAIFLSNDDEVVVHSVGYGNSTAATPNVGSVGSTKSAYFAGDTDEGADLAANWRVTTSLTARANRPRVPTALPIVFGGPWSPLPTGFTGNGLDAPYSTSLGGDTATGSAKFAVANDSLTIGFSAQATSVTYQIKGNPASGTATSGTFVVLESPDGTTYSNLRTITNATNSDTGYSDLPAAGTRYLKYLYQTKTAGNIQLDKLTITGSTANALTFAVTPGTFAENVGSNAATGTISISTAAASALTVSLASSDTSEATVPATVTIAAGQTSSPAFAIEAVDDTNADGPQQVTLTASAIGYANGAFTLTVTDNEPSVEGVTPATANNGVNAAFVAALRSGSLNSPALFRTGAGAVIPAGLTLDPATGLLSGTLSANNPAGAYQIVIERYNTLGETVSQSWTLTLGGTAGQTYANWISAYPGAGALTGVTDDPDKDGLPNGIENYLGTLPTVATPGFTQVSATPATLVFRHTRSNTPATDLTAGYEWSTDLTAWQLSAATAGGVSVTIGTITITDTSAPDNDLIEVTANVTAGTPKKLFVRLKTTRF